MGWRLSGSLALLLGLAAARVHGQGEVITGAGATFPLPLYRVWLPRILEDTGLRIVYRACGSGQGVLRLRERSVDFGATDQFLSDAELAGLPGPVLHLPTCIGGVAVVYNLPGVKDLRLAPEDLADIFLGRVTRWNDGRLASDNRGAPLPDQEIAVVHRSDASGTTGLFTSYLSAVSEAWRERIGSGLVVPWACGIGVERSDGVARFVRRIPASIGYVELNYADAEGLTTALLRNQAGRYVKPSVRSVAAASRVELPTDLRVHLSNTPAAEGYPIVAFTYLVFYREQAYDGRTRERAQSLARFLWWAVHEGQEYHRGLNYVPLPPAAVKLSEGIIGSLRYAGAPLKGLGP